MGIAHRGDSGNRPENTLSAFRSASELGVDMIEFDIQPSRDMQLVVVHDETVDRTTRATGKVAEMDLDDIKTLDAGSWFSPRFGGERIPTLKETLEAVPGWMKLNIEMKHFPGTRPYAEEMVKILHEYDLHGRVFVATRESGVIEALKNVDQLVRCILIQGDRGENAFLSDALDLGVDVLQIRRSSLNGAFIDRIHEQGLSSFLFFADTPEEMNHAIEMRIDGILTNWPGRMVGMLGRRSSLD